METGRNLAVLKRQHRFEKSCDSGRGFQMAEISFDGADREWRVGGSIAAESFRESMRLNRISHRRASSVGFDEANLFGRNPRIRASVLHQSCLRLRAGQRDTVGVSILIERRPQESRLESDRHPRSPAKAA